MAKTESAKLKRFFEPARSLWVMGFEWFLFAEWAMISMEIEFSIAIFFRL